MARIWRNWRTVSGMVTTRTSIVKTMIATPICEKHTAYNTSKVLSMGRMMTSFHSRTNMEKNSTGVGLCSHGGIGRCREFQIPGLIHQVLVSGSVDGGVSCTRCFRWCRSTT